MNALLEGLKGLGIARLTMLGAVAFAMFALLAVLAIRGPNEHMASLYADLELREAGQIAELLDRQKIPHQVSATGTQILVAVDDVPRARMLLAKDGLPTGGSIGNELLDRGDNLTASQFQQGINQARALEGELARSIRSIRGVKAARVHLVLPKREPFSRDQQEAQASVLLTLTGNTMLDRSETAAIVNLVAAAVPGLRPQNVAVTDTRGNLLARAGAPVGTEQMASSHDELKVVTEHRLSRAVEDMLALSLGPNRARAETTIAYDYEQLRETQEKYDPDGQVVRSSQTVTSSSKSTEQASSVSVQNNLPNADSSGTPSGNQEQRQEETTNYEVTKTVRTIIRDQPKIARISMAVMVDGVAQKLPDGSLGWQERKPEDLAQIARLVRSSIGFDEKRGDVVEVVSMRFAASPDQADDPVGARYPFGLEKADVVRLANTGLVGLLALIAALVVLRPMVGKITLAGKSGAGMLEHGGKLVGGTLVGGMLVGGAGTMREMDGSTAHAALGGGAGIAGLLPGPGGKSSEAEGLLSVANVEGQLRASSIKKISDLVERHPDESLAIIRAWMHQEAA